MAQAADRRARVQALSSQRVLEARQRLHDVRSARSPHASDVTAKLSEDAATPRAQHLEEEDDILSLF